MTIKQIAAARASLSAALEAEGEALTSACKLVKAQGAASDQAVKALRSAQAAHARSNAAAGELRAMALEVDGEEAIVELAAGPAERFVPCTHSSERTARS